MKKIVVSALIFLILIGGVFALTGCGKKEDNANQNNTNPIIHQVK